MPPCATVTLAAGALIVAVGAMLAAPLTVITRETGAETRPWLSVTVSVAVKVPALLKNTLISFLVEVAGVPPGKLQLNLRSSSSSSLSAFPWNSIDLPWAMVRFCLGSSMIATGCCPTAVTVTMRETGVEASPKLLVTVKVTVKVPAVLNVTAPGLCAVELGAPPPKFQL